jgi:predicted XRE-type DNA-binding protein
MKPAPAESSIYYRIQNQPLEIGEKDLALIFDQVRFDPRLMEVATEFLRDYWWNMNPKILNQRLKKIKSPFAIKPAILAIIKNSTFLNEDVRQGFLTWHESVTAGIKNPNPQLFYIALNKIGSKSMRREEQESLPCFSTFNLLAKDLPFNKAHPGFVKGKEEGLKFATKDFLKTQCALKIKNFKQSNAFSNVQIMKKLGINRTFLSKILNSKLDGITLDYLSEKAEGL